MTSPMPWDPDQVTMKEVNVGDKDRPYCIYDESIKKYSYKKIDLDETFLHEIDPSLI